MSVKFSTITAETPSGVTARHTFARQDESDQLLIILPGYGYMGDYPLLYYLRRSGLQRGYDVFSVEYGFQAAHTEFDFSKMPELQAEVNRTLGSLPARGYRRICIAGKSMGTPLAIGLAHTLSAPEISLILLTPISGAVQMAGDIPALAIIGTADSRYNPADIQNTPTLQWRVYDDLDHSLEKPGDWQASLAVLPDIIAACADFLA
jgi:esterase/lipase